MKLDVYAACPEPDTSPYFRFSQEYGFVSTNIGTMTPLISRSLHRRFSEANFSLQGSELVIVKVILKL